jgi:hypothetical protein
MRADQARTTSLQTHCEFPCLTFSPASEPSFAARLMQPAARWPPNQPDCNAWICRSRWSIHAQNISAIRCEFTAANWQSTYRAEQQQ